MYLQSSQRLVYVVKNALPPCLGRVFARAVLITLLFEMVTLDLHRHLLPMFDILYHDGGILEVRQRQGQYHVH